MEQNLIRPYNDETYPEPIVKVPEYYRVKDGKLVKQKDDYYRMFGVECEVEFADSCKSDRYAMAREIMKGMGKDFVVIKHDGSLTNHPREDALQGFEIVTAPADLEAHRLRWEPFEKLPCHKFMRAWDTKTCGLHVHISRDVLTTLQISRMSIFINSKKNHKFIAEIAGRSCGEKGFNRVIDKGLGQGHKPDPDKYVAVNVQHKKTIEIRIFRGTVRYRHIIRNIEFVDALASFCHPASRSLGEITSVKHFCRFVHAHAKQWPLLAEWLAAKQLIPAKKLAPGAKPEPVVELELVEKGEAQRNH